MAATRYVALIRGINVGGGNPVDMAALRAAFEDEGHTDVTSYIRSGNVLFRSTVARAKLETDLEAMLARRFETPVMVVVRSHAQLRKVVADAPAGFGEEPDTYHSDAVFLRTPLTPAKALKVVQLRDGVDQVWPGTGLLYFSRVSAERTKSKMGKIVGTSEYRLMTIRSWATTTKLLTLLDAPTAG